jgi:hypothetical protein
MSILTPTADFLSNFAHWRGDNLSFSSVDVFMYWKTCHQITAVMASRSKPSEQMTTLGNSTSEMGKPDLELIKGSFINDVTNFGGEV